MLIDGIPESIVIGSEFRSLVAEQQIREGAFSLVGVIPYTFVAGLFLSNFPEALSSSVGMREQGWAPARVLGLWSSLFVLTAVGSGAGYAIAYLGELATKLRQFDLGLLRERRKDGTILW